MNNTRRTFLKNSAMTVAGAALLPKQFFGAGKANEIVGIQLYSVRDDMKKDPAGTLQQLAKIGYKYVEHADYVNRKFYGYSAPEFKKLLDGMGLKMFSGHTVMSKKDWNE